MYLLQLVQALKYENFTDIQGGLEPASKRDSQGVLTESSTIGDLDRSATYLKNMRLSEMHCFSPNQLYITLLRITNYFKIWMYNPQR